MKQQTYSKGYEDNREFLVYFDKDCEFGLIKHLYYEFPLPMSHTSYVRGNFIFSRIDFNAIYHYLKINNLLRDRLHDLLIDGEKLFEDSGQELVIPDFNIDTREDIGFFSVDNSNVHPLLFTPEAGVMGIIGITLKDNLIGSLDIHTPYTFTAKNVLFMSENSSKYQITVS